MVNDIIRDFISKGKDKKKELLKNITGNSVENDIIFIGIPAGLGRSYKNVEQDVNKLITLLFRFSKDKDLGLLFNNLKKSNIKCNATTTTIMYLFFSNKFIPIAGGVSDLLCKLGIDIKADSWDNYKQILNKLRECCQKFCCKEPDFKASFSIALSFSAWLESNKIENILGKFTNKDTDKPKNIILTGIPGTGKTHTVMEYLKNHNDVEYEFVQFHPSYDYEDFIEGFKPVASSSGQIEFKLVNGVFKQLCKEAYENINSNTEDKKTYIMVIDEINRANLSRVFGELLYCLEYRDEFVSTKMTTYIQSLNQKDAKESLNQEDAKKYSISLEADKIGKFVIPSNVIILGTMNEVDRSIDAFDLALRRRFIWEEIGFNETALRLYSPFFVNGFQSNIEDLLKKANDLNKELKNNIGVNYQLGHTYFYKIVDYYENDYDSALCDLWEYHLKSILKEYLKIKFGDDDLETKLKDYKKIIVGDKNSCGK